MTTSQETAVRTAAAALLTAINEARAVGLDVRWPSFPGGLAVIAISETGKAKVVPTPTIAAAQTPVAAAAEAPSAAAIEAPVAAPLAKPPASPVADALAEKASVAPPPVTLPSPTPAA